MVHRTLTFKEAVDAGTIQNILQTDNALASAHNKDWEILFQAQHLGLPTRLLDWTIDRRMGLLFAVENDKYHGQDGHVWLFIGHRNYLVTSSNLSTILSHQPLLIPQSYMINYPFFHSDNWRDLIAEMRRAKQSSRFSIQHSSILRIPLDNQKAFYPVLAKIIVDGNSKKAIKDELETKYGLTLTWAYYKRSRWSDFVIKLIKNKNVKKCRLSSFVLFLLNVISRQIP